MREAEPHLANCPPDVPDAVGIGRGTGCTFKQIREALRQVEVARRAPSRHWVRSRREAANRLRGLTP